MQAASKKLQLIFFNTVVTFLPAYASKDKTNKSLMQANILVPLIIFAAIFGMVYVFLTTRNKERLALIEKGADASLFNTGRKGGLGLIVLNLALLAIGIGVGVLAGSGLAQTGMEKDVSFPACIFIFGGLGLLIGFFLGRKLEKD